MEKKRKNHGDTLRILFTFVVLFLCTADSYSPHTTTHCDDCTSPETVGVQASAAPVASTAPHAIHKMTDYATNTFTTTSAGLLNATESVSNVTYSETSYTSPNSTDITSSEPTCLQGWAIFLICLGAIMTVFLLAAIPIMLYCFLHGRNLPPQKCPERYNRKIYVAPEEQALELE